VVYRGRCQANWSVQCDAKQSDQWWLYATNSEVQAQLREEYHELEKESSMELPLPRPVVRAPDLARE